MELAALVAVFDVSMVKGRYEPEEICLWILPILEVASTISRRL